MASSRGFAWLVQPSLTYSTPISLRRRRFFPPRIRRSFCLQLSTRIRCHQNPSSSLRKFRDFRLSRSVELDRFITSEGGGEEMSEGFFEAIEELERMTRDPSDILEEMNNRLSLRELQLVLVYFSQEGRDSWCALEVFEWLKKENRVDKETMELMVSIMCSWVKKLIQDDCDAAQVFDLLIDMECVGMNPGFSMIEKAISLYWEIGKKDKAILFVKEVLRRRDNAVYHVHQYDGGDGRKSGPTGYLAWKMMGDGDYTKAVDLVIDIRESGFQPEVYSYLIAMTAIVKELNGLMKALRRLKVFTQAGLVAELDGQGLKLVQKYQSDLITKGLQFARWTVHEGKSNSIQGMAHERVLAMYICSGRGIEAERQLWEMKLAGKNPDPDLHDVVLAICASQNELNAVSRLLAGIEIVGSMRKKKMLTWLLRGYIKGGNFEYAAKTLMRMMDSGLSPEYMDRVAVMQGMAKKIERQADVEAYMDLCKRLFDAGFIGPSVLYLYINKYNLWIVNML